MEYDKIRQKFISKFVSIPVFDKMRAPVHTTGGAVDLTLIDTNGKPLNMGTDFDDFSEKANTDYYERHFNQEITKNRRLLYNAMINEGFTNIPSEWWHYDYGDSYWGFYKGEPPFYGGFSNLEMLEKQTTLMFHMFLVGDKMKKDNIIRYYGIRCVVLRSYFSEKDGPLLRLVDPKDKQKAYALGFKCIGYPNEIVKYITKEEYKKLTQQ